MSCRFPRKICRPIAEWRRRRARSGEITALWNSENALAKKIKSFPSLVKPKPGETVVFSWIVFKSRAHRDTVNAKVMKDTRLAKMMDMKTIPFDSKRMAYGGFEVMVDV